MKSVSERGLLLLAAGILLGLAILGFLLKEAVHSFKQYERTVTVRGLSEQEHLADIVIWPIRFTETSNNLEEIYQQLEESSGKIVQFLESNGVASDEITVAAPIVTDRSAQVYGESNYPFRYVATQTVTVYSREVEQVRDIMNDLVDLGKQGVTITGDEYMDRTEYLYTRLNDIKPMMIEEATREARKVAQKFAEDSDSRLGKIKTASQGQFSISPRDNNNPHIKNVRVVSTIVYYLSD
mgnify:CR=1 FL=1